MRTINVDERDSTWERNDPRFRAYIFRGADNAATTIDILDATIEQALESTAALSDDNEHLWSLALVSDDARGMRGLVWLSGMDYNDTPATPRDWQLRRQMQDRYLLAQRHRGLACVLPNGLRVIRVFPDWGSGLPLWENFTDEYRLSGSALHLSEPLIDALYDWNETWQRRKEDEPVSDGWQERGQDLVSWLQTELKGIAEVRPEFLD